MIKNILIKLGNPYKTAYMKVPMIVSPWQYKMGT